MSSELDSGSKNISKASWIPLAVIGSLSTLSALYVAATPAGQQTTLAGRSWESFAAADPEVARLFSLQLVLVGLTFMAFSLMAVTLTLIPYRRGERWAWVTLWLVPLAYGGIAARMLIVQYQVGYMYLGLFVVSLIAMLIPIRRFASSAQTQPK